VSVCLLNLLGILDRMARHNVALVEKYLMYTEKLSHLINMYYQEQKGFVDPCRIICFIFRRCYINTTYDLCKHCNHRITSMHG